MKILVKWEQPINVFYSIGEQPSSTVPFYCQHGSLLMEFDENDSIKDLHDHIKREVKIEVDEKREVLAGPLRISVDFL